MSFKETILLIYSDSSRYSLENKKNYFSIWFTCPGLWVTTIYRLMRYFKYEFKIPVFKQVIYLFLNVIAQILKFMTCIELYPKTKIGKGLYIPHIGNIIIHSDSIIGDYCTILQGTTIGNNGKNNESGVPKIGDRVKLCAGSVIIGDIKIGNGVVIGANAVVTKDIPDNAIVAGIPATILNYKGSENFIRYKK